MTDEELSEIVERLLPHIEDSQVRRKKEDKCVKDLVEAMLEQQAHESEQKAKRWQFVMRYIAGPLVAFIVGGGSVAGYQIANRPASPRPEQLADQAADQAATKASLPVKERVVDLENKVQRLGEVAVEQQVQISDGVHYIADKIDAAHPNKADKIKEPESVEAARIKADAIKKSKRVDELFDAENPDPFARLPKID